MINAQHIQKLGRSLSAMVMPNIGAFIAWGLLAAMFIPTGWFPNETLAGLVSPILKYLLPLLIAYTAGMNVYSVRGGVIGALASMGVIVGSDIPMFIGAMIMGPLAAWVLKKFDQWSSRHIKSGFEMLVSNFSLAIIGILLVISGYYFFGKAITWVTDLLGKGAELVISNSLLPLVALFVEPAKVLFLNNALNHGIFSPIGIEQVQETGRSLMFLIETNPGPGLGLLAAISLLGKDSERKSSLGAIVIQFLGGIHEIYFPYVLARPALLVASIAGSASGLFFFSLFDSGLVAPASPGSIISILAMAPKGGTFLVFAGVMISAIVSFMVAAPLVRIGKKEDNSAPLEFDESIAYICKFRTVVFACDAGMGSSALGATRFAARLGKAGVNIEVRHSPVDNIPAEAQVVVCQEQLSSRALKNAPSVHLVVIRNFLQDVNLDRLFECIVSSSERGAASSCSFAEDPAEEVLARKNIKVGLKSCSKEDAIRMAGKVLTEGGYVSKEYAESMIQRENEATTYMGFGVAIPHGTSDAKERVLKSGICVLQFPDGVDFGGDKARLVIGIAGVGDEHMEILSHLAEVLEDEDVMSELSVTSDIDYIYEKLK